MGLFFLIPEFWNALTAILLTLSLHLKAKATEAPYKEHHHK